MRPPLFTFLLLAAGAAAAAPLDLPSAIRRALVHSPVLRAGASAVEAARDDAAAARAAHLPTLELGARAVRTSEPAGAFALRLDEGRLGAADFDPARLNAPAAVGGIGLSALLNLPLYSGGRAGDGERAARGLAQAEEQSQERRKQQIAFALVRSWFGIRAAAQATLHAQEAVQAARDTEGFVRERVAQGLLLEADALRATAFRAEAEARLAQVRGLLGSTRAALEMLIGEEVDADAIPAGATENDDALSSISEGNAAPDRPDLRAASLRSSAAQAQASAASGALLPEVFLQASAHTLRSALDQGTTWTALVLGARWELSLGAVHTASAARARAAAAASSAQAESEEARREAQEARFTLDAATARTAAAREAVAASESARRLRKARYLQGLLPLTDLLDAELALANSQALLVQSLLEIRLARASLQLARGQAIEGVQP